MSRHNQYYERTYPIFYNYQNDKQPVIIDSSKSNYYNTDGIMYLTVGTAGDELDPVKERPNFYVLQESKFGFLEIKVKNDGKRLVGQFHTNDGKVVDQFTLNDT